MATAKTTVQIVMPAMGESVTEGTVLDWLKQVGDTVEADEPLVGISTDKVDAEVPAPAAGVLMKTLVEADQVVQVGDVLGEIEAGGEPVSSDGSGNGGQPVSDGNGAGAPEAAPETPAADAETVEVAFPEMGDSVAEGTILEWRVAPGDTVAVDDPLVEISTDKVDAEVPSPVAGTIVELRAEPDQTVPVGTVLCRIAVSDAASASGGPIAPAAHETETRPGTDAAPEGSDPLSGGDSRGLTPSPNGTDGVTPVAARMAHSHGLDVSNVAGSGPRGRVTKADVEAALAGNGASESAAKAPPPPPGGESQAIRGPAATLARFMDESRSIPTATSFRTLAVDRLAERRTTLKGAGRKLSFTHLIAWAIVRAIHDMPVMAHSFAEVDGKPHRVTPGTLSLGLAVDMQRKDGSRSLVVPVIRDAGTMTFSDFVAAYDEAVAGARDNKLAPDAYAGAQITLTNPGGIGTVASVPRLMPGQGTIIATGAIGYPPGLAQADPAKLAELGVAKVMTMTSTYDHRVIQGAESGAFLKRIDELLQ
nr:2-oxo acid dehydrogenase subunit E2 [Thermoleophilaceae bacterium]